MQKKLKLLHWDILHRKFFSFKRKSSALNYPDQITSHWLSPHQKIKRKFYEKNNIYIHKYGFGNSINLRTG